jgi:hypothetical protein
VMVCSRVLMVEGEVEVAGLVRRVVSDLKKTIVSIKL